jgi:transcriptional regulator with XRE-family HTH domain
MELRAYCNISPTELGRAVGVNKATIWQYENGKTRIPSKRLEAIARALHCEDHNLHMPPGSPLPRLRFRPTQRQTAPRSSLGKIDLKIPFYRSVSADEPAFSE